MGSLAAIYDLNENPVNTETLAKMSRASIRKTTDESSLLSVGFSANYNYTYTSLSGQHTYSNEDKSIIIVVSGRLYYLDKLIVKIKNYIPNYAPGTQAEIIFDAYTIWQEDVFPHIDGDFTIIIRDTKKQLLLAARDQLGVKPLYFSQMGSSLFLASEQRQILAAGVSSAPSNDAIAHYLSLNQTLTGGTDTFYRNISQLPAGHFMRVHKNDMSIHEYWQLDPNKELDTADEDEMAHQLQEIMKTAVAERIPKDGPYGCALSGGFDSSSVAGLYRMILDEKNIDRHLDTFSFELRDDAADEPELIKAVAKQVNSKHNHIYVDQDNVFDVLPDMIQAMEHPTYDMGLLYLWRKKEEAAKHEVYTMLSGLGGDEVFMGRYYYFADLFKKGRWIELAQELKSLYPIDKSTGKPTSLAFLMRAYVVSPLIPESFKSFVRKNLMGNSVVKPWIRSDLADKINLKEKLALGPYQLYSDAYRQEAYETFQYIMVNITLPIHQSLGAAHNVDTRFPLLDKYLVEFMFAAPREVKIKKGSSRILQRKAMDGILPEIVTEEHLKKNVNPVLWKQQSKNFLGELDKLFSNKDLNSYEYVNKSQIASIYSDFKHKPESGLPGYVLWYILNLETWLKNN